MGIIFFKVIKRDPDSALSAEVMTNLMIWEMARTGPFHLSLGSFSD